jgi:Domain of unknown function (DUF1814).
MDTMEVCRLVARSLIAEIGPWGDRCALFGGLVPGLLLPQPTEPLLPHIGTRDVDLAIRVAALGDEELYRTLKNNLAALHLKQSPAKSFEWTRTIEGVEATVELFVPVEDAGQGGKIQRKPIEQSGSGLTALGIYGLDLIERDLVGIEDEGPLLDGKGVKRVSLRVCGPTMLLALKAWALHERVKTKDGYDIVWILKAKGSEEIARRFREIGLIETDFGRGALDFLAEHYQTHEHTGPAGWVTESKFEEQDREREARDAHGIVSEFLNRVTRK